MEPRSEELGDRELGPALCSGQHEAQSEAQTCALRALIASGDQAARVDRCALAFRCLDNRSDGGRALQLAIALRRHEDALAGLEPSCVVVRLS